MVSTSFFWVLRPSALPQSAWLIHHFFSSQPGCVRHQELDHNEKNWIPFQREGKTYVARSLREPQGTAQKTWQKDAKGIYDNLWHILGVRSHTSDFLGQLKHFHVDVPELLPISGIHGKVCHGRYGSVQLGFSWTHRFYFCLCMLNFHQSPIFTIINQH